jgi:hypothetical protein
MEGCLRRRSGCRRNPLSTIARRGCASLRPLVRASHNLAFCNKALERSAPFSMLLSSRAPVRFAPVSFSPVKTTPERFAPLSRACDRSASGSTDRDRSISYKNASRSRTPPVPEYGPISLEQRALGEKNVIQVRTRVRLPTISCRAVRNRISVAGPLEKDPTTGVDVLLQAMRCARDLLESLQFVPVAVLRGHALHLRPRALVIVAVSVGNDLKPVVKHKWAEPGGL